MAFLSTSIVLDALKARLTEAVFPDDHPDDEGGVSELAGEAIFEVVTVSDAPDLGIVLTRLVAVTERIAAVVPGVETFREDSNTGRIQRKQKFTLMYSTQDFDPFADPAVFSTTGLISIAEIVVEDLLKPFGEKRSPLRKARIRPGRGGSQLVTTEEAAGESAREVYFLELEATMGSAAVCS